MVIVIIMEGFAIFLMNLFVIVIAACSGEMKMNCKIRKNLSKGPRNPFYINAAWFHLKRPSLKIRRKSTVDGYPIIHVDTGKAQ